MKIKYEFLNFLTGIILMTTGIIDLSRKQVPLALNWIIFGSMYLIMDDYHPDKNFVGPMDSILDLGRKIFCWVGLLGSIFLLVYYMFGYK